LKETTAMGNRVAGSRRVGKEIRLLAEEVAFVGVDVHKKTYTVSVWTERRGRVARWTQPADPAVLCRRLEGVRGQVAQVVYEAGPTGFGLVRALWREGFPAEVVAPSQVPTTVAGSDKSDGRDADDLAFFSGKGMLKGIYVPSVEQEADRQVERRRDQVREDLGRAKRRIKSFLLQYGLAEPAGLEHWSTAAVEDLRRRVLVPEVRFCLDSLLRDYDHAREEFHACEKAMAELARSERHRRDMAAMRQVPGVGVVTALTHALELPRPERFTRGEEVASCLGLAPRTSRSGSTSKGGPIRKAGNRRLRRVLVEAAWQWVRLDSRGKALYRHLLQCTGTAQKAIVGVARHLGILLWRLRVTGERYVPGVPPGEEAAPLEGKQEAPAC
jgi:transposase